MVSNLSVTLFYSNAAHTHSPNTPFVLQRSVAMTAPCPYAGERWRKVKQEAPPTASSLAWNIAANFFPESTHTSFLLIGCLQWLSVKAQAGHISQAEFPHIQTFLCGSVTDRHPPPPPTHWHCFSRNIINVAALMLLSLQADFFFFFKF